MFNKAHLEALEDILETFTQQHEAQQPGDETVSHEMLKELKGLVRAALWAIPRTIPRKDKAAIAAAEKAGRVQIVGRNTEPSPTVKAKSTPTKIVVNSGADLLSALGLD